MKDPLLAGLPHRDPFVFVDRVLDHEPGVFARCEKTFVSGDPLFTGHFPGNPIVPGVILTEALAQTAGIAGASGDPNARYLLSAIRSMKFPVAVNPGETIRLEARKAGDFGNLLQFEVVATVNGSVVAEGQIILNKTIPNEITSGPSKT